MSCNSQLVLSLIQYLQTHGASNQLLLHWGPKWSVASNSFNVSHATKHPTFRNYFSHQDSMLTVNTVLFEGRCFACVTQADDITTATLKGNSFWTEKCQKYLGTCQNQWIYIIKCFPIEIKRHIWQYCR